MINLVFETAEHDKVTNTPWPFPECGAMSQGYIGYHLQNALRAELCSIGIQRSRYAGDGSGGGSNGSCL
jgi:carbamate kinase